MFRGNNFYNYQRFATSVFFAVVAFFMLAPVAIAGSSQGIAYTGRILRPDGTPANSGSITFTLKLMDAANNCRLWSETQTMNMTDTAGTFSLVIGAGTRTDGGSQTLKQVFTNAGTLSGLSCNSGTTYTPAAGDDRNLAVSFDDAGTAVSLATVAIKSVPFALQADQVSGYGIMNLAKISGLGSANTMTGTQFDFLTNLAAPASASATPCAANDMLKFVGGVWTCAAAGTGSAATSGLTAATATNTVDNTNYAQTWNWSTATSENPMTIAANNITTGSLLNLTTSSAAVNSTNGVLNVANTSATTTGVLARFQSNSTAGSGLTVLANGNVGIGTTTPGSKLEVQGNIGIANNVIGGGNSFGCSGCGASTSIELYNSGTAAMNFNGSAAGSEGINFNLNGAKKMVIAVSGNVGIGTATPRSPLDVNGTIVGKPSTSNATSTIDFLTGNIQYTTSNCGAFQFDNLKDGGTYAFIVKGSTAATCTFTAFSGAGTGPLTVHMPPDNGNTIASKHTIFNLMVGGSDVYVAWTPGY
jgi:hypothetical protein